MKTPTEIKFDNIIKHGFHEILKPKGFKKKGNNFYLQLSELGQIINIQKSVYYSREHIHFTINTGIFVPEHWKGLLYNQGKELPVYPTEPECLIRKRIGELKNHNDTWYDVNGKAEEAGLVSEMKGNLEQYILPYFNTVKTRENLLALVETKQLDMEPLEKLIVYGELKLMAKAKAEYESMLERKLNPYFLETVKEYGVKYGLV